MPPSHFFPSISSPPSDLHIGWAVSTITEFPPQGIVRDKFSLLKLAHLCVSAQLAQEEAQSCFIECSWPFPSWCKGLLLAECTFRIAPHLSTNSFKLYLHLIIYLLPWYLPYCVFCPPAVIDASLHLKAVCDIWIQRSCYLKKGWKAHWEHTVFHVLCMAYITKKL